MLVGYDPRETWESILYRFRELVALGCEPYPMVYDRSRADLRAFQRYAVRHLYRSMPPHLYGAHGHEDIRLTDEARAELARAWGAVEGGWKPRPRSLSVAPAGATGGA